ncbi:leucine-rich repeat and WD repeat-containing protein 1 isoform X2 [Rhinatrema bivittatum]|uniref:leucine-rich repeat and WD repeat-containing protein 1 isoform X2 n=1 Tax=Rhinatrema bivittatum TaxID=194408 RepID=UPI0011282D73|nr:leucine-rich repeat and WD repeat-containing protein 1 isoform X2 [Rhinatrema bivittatum]
MTKLTMKLLLGRGLPKSTHLQELKTLNLSKLHLRAQDLDLKLFSQLEKLEELDLSDNVLSEVPSGLMLPRLRVLNCSSNQLEDVTSLRQFPCLEQLTYEDNLYLTISDNYKVMYLLPNLCQLNSKDVRSLANQVRLVNTTELTRRVHSHWEKNYREQLPETPSAASIKSVAGHFVKSAVLGVKYGANSLKDFTKWRVQQIAEELIASLLTPEKEEDGAGGDRVLALPVLRSSSKRKHMCEVEFSQGSPSKKPQKNHHSPMPASPISRRSDHLQATPGKYNRTPDSPRDRNQNERAASIQDTPRKRERSQVHTHGWQPAKRSHQDLKEEKTLQAGEELLEEWKGLSATPGKKGKSKEVVHLEPHHFLQCHSRENSCEDFKTQLWACAFQPHLEDASGKESSERLFATVATCGGDSVCVIDCETGKVLKKYKVAGEEFFSVAWTCLAMVDMEGRRRKFSVLAAAGRRGTVKLMHVKANLCYGEIKAHKKPISVLCFSPTQETFLFTGSYDKRIILWNIGVPDSDYNFKASQLLTLETSSVPLRLSLVPACPDHYLLGACEDGCFAWDIRLNKQEGRRPFDFEFQFPVYARKDKDNNFRMVDGLAVLNQDLVEEGRVFCGDEKGSVWLYDLSHRTQKKDPSVQKVAPSQILNWPYLTTKGQKKQVNGTVINSVAVDPTFKYLVALTDQNIIAIWKIM